MTAQQKVSQMEEEVKVVLHAITPPRSPHACHAEGRDQTASMCCRHGSRERRVLVGSPMSPGCLSQKANHP